MIVVKDAARAQLTRMEGGATFLMRHSRAIGAALGGALAGTADEGGEARIDVIRAKQEEGHVSLVLQGKAMQVGLQVDAKGQVQVTYASKLTPRPV